MTRAVVLPLRLLVLAAMLLTLLVAVPPAADESTSAEQGFVAKINQERSARGLHKVAVRSDLRSVARGHSKTMASKNKLHHNTALAKEVTNWQRLTENVGRGGTVASLHTALMKSAGHRANILDPRVTQVGVGVVVSGNTMWVTQVFRLPRGASVPKAPAAKSFPGGFSDVAASSTHGKDIDLLRRRGITSGCSSNRYCPKNTVTRAQMASFLTRALKLPSAGGNRFRDVRGTHAADINALARAGVTTGCNPPKNDRFCPNKPVTRAQMATFLARGLKLGSAGGNRFGDVRGTHTADVNALASAGVTTGCNPPKNNRYCPGQSVTRAQMASFLIRGLDR